MSEIQEIKTLITKFPIARPRQSAMSIVRRLVSRFQANIRRQRHRSDITLERWRSLEGRGSEEPLEIPQTRNNLYWRI